jgi:uncharacterized membrane protein
MVASPPMTVIRKSASPLFYKENLGLKQLIGIALCIVGLMLVNG